MKTLEEITCLLKEGGIESYRFEAKQLFEAFKDEELEQAVNRRLSGEPLQYILGVWEFMGLPFYVGKGVLIPRPDTELLCEQAIEYIGDKNLKVLDLCSGSGALAVTLKKKTKAEVTAIEISLDAAAYLNKNALLNQVEVEVIRGDILTDIPTGTFDLIVSNPPYIRTDVIDSLDREVRCEPRLALDGGNDGLLFYRRIASYWKTKLNPCGRIMVEIGFDQKDEVCEILGENGFKDIRCEKDLSGNDRVIIGTLSPETT